MRPFRIILILFFSVCSYGYSQTLSKNELNQISENIKEHSIIGLGEAEHFRKGYYTSKFDIIKHLIENKLINVIALEASMNVTSLLNGYISGTLNLDLHSTLASLNEPYSLQKAGLYDCIEIAKMVNWLKSYNDNNPKKIRLVGIDFQNYSIPLDSLKNYVSESNDQLHKIKDTKQALDSCMYAILNSNIMIITSPEWLKRLKRAQQNVKSLKSRIGNNKNEQLFLELEQFTSLWDDPLFPRDAMMFENLKSHIDKKSRILIWAANFHLENDRQFKGPKKLGVFLKENYSSKYFIIGVTEQINGTKPTVIYPSKNADAGKYDMIIQVNKGDKCDRL